MVTVQEPANDALGVATTKEVEVLLKFEGVFSGKMLYGKKPLKGSAAHINLYDAYGITPRKYEFADGLDAAATLPFFDVVGDKKKKYVFCATRVGRSAIRHTSSPRRATSTKTCRNGP